MQQETKPNFWALTPLIVFLSIYLIASLIMGDFYKMPITVAFLVSSVVAVAISSGGKLHKRIDLFCKGAANSNIMLMVWIFILAGAFAQTAKAVGAVDATVDLALSVLPDSLLLAGMFIAACFISLSRELLSVRLWHLPRRRRYCRTNRHKHTFHGSHRGRRSHVRG